MTQYNLNVAINPNLVGEYIEFIGQFKKALDPEVCEDLIKTFNEQNYLYEVGLNEGNRVFREDFALDIQQLPLAEKYGANIQYALSTGIDDYRKVFEGTKIPLHTTFKKIQKTPPGGGYHVWHCEDNNFSFGQRFLTWMIYLNTVEEGGETEFLYQSLRIKPEQGTLVIWPSSYTHMHRGNPPLSETKYVVTGWYELMP